MRLPASTLVESLRQHALLAPDRLDDLARHSNRQDAAALAQDLVRRHWLTSWQAGQLLRGRAADLAFGDFVLLDRLGEGGIGQVFRARHPRWPDPVALKLIRPQLLGDADVVKRFRREIDIARQLDHPHVVRALDAGAVGTACYLVMEYLDGIDLARLVREQGPLPLPLACHCLRQGALALQYVHEQKLVHRDVKPPNFLLLHGPDHHVKLLDLGLARLQYRLNKTGKTTLVTVLGDATMIGTPDYLAPEQALDFHAADIRSDLYSLGCTVHYLLTGEPPFPGGTLPTKLLRHQQEAPPDVRRQRPEVPEELAALLRQLLAKRPGERPQKPAEVAAALVRWSQGTGGSTAIRTASTAPTRLDPRPHQTAVQRPSANRRRRWLAVAGGLICLSLGLFGLLHGSGRPDRPTVSQARPSTAVAQVPAPAEEVVLVPASAPGWRFAPATAVTDLGERWLTREFSAPDWPTGSAPLGHGTGNEIRELTNRGGTTIADRGISIAFHLTFEVHPDVPRQVGRVLRLRVASDNCATVWLNGSVADEEQANHDFKYWNRQVEVDVQLLQAGRNALAALVTNTRGSSDIYFDVELTALPAR